MVNLMNVLKTATKHPIKSISVGLRHVTRGLPNVRSNVVPFAPAGVSTISKAPNIISKAYQGTKTFIQRATVNPFAGTTVKQGFSNYGKKILGGVTTGVGIGSAFGVSRYASGVESNLGTAIKKGATFGLAGGISPYGAVAGTVSAVGTKTNEKAQDLINAIKNSNMPQIPQNLGYSTYLDYPDLSGLYDRAKSKASDLIPSFNISMPAMSMPAITMPNIEMPSFSPSMSVGDGGMSSITPLLLAGLLGGGALGYAIGKRKKRKRRKKKKYK